MSTSNSQPVQRTSLQVIGGGLPRTSTSSLQDGLQILGFAPCYHTITDLIPRARTQGLMWLKAMQTEDKAVRQKILAGIVQGYSAIVDGPGCFFVEDWIEMYPDAKVVLACAPHPKPGSTQSMARLRRSSVKGPCTTSRTMYRKCTLGFR